MIDKLGRFDHKMRIFGHLVIEKASCCGFFPLRTIRGRAYCFYSRNHKFRCFLVCLYIWFRGNMFWVTFRWVCDPIQSCHIARVLPINVHRTWKSILVTDCPCSSDKYFLLSSLSLMIRIGVDTILMEKYYIWWISLCQLKSFVGEN